MVQDRVVAEVAVGALVVEVVVAFLPLGGVGGLPRLSMATFGLCGIGHQAGGAIDNSARPTFLSAFCQRAVVVNYSHQYQWYRVDSSYDVSLYFRILTTLVLSGLPK
ncbi:hypothetical protein ACJRO7_014777 [Eucalyptus globulus]|uniref:Secreted protein n=1 Tax=Eucalyptus globulus TaxID=34317 RepID=A0ABD3L1A7_EUCGL